MIELKDQASICELLPHAGTMCLLNEVVDVNAEQIICLSKTHLDVDNPLRVEGKLYAMAGIEYASQTIALHGQIETIHTGARPMIGFLMTVRNMIQNVEYLDDVRDSLLIEANQTMRIEGAVNYDFTITASNELILSGRMTTKLMHEVPVR